LPKGHIFSKNLGISVTFWLFSTFLTTLFGTSSNARYILCNMTYKTKKSKMAEKSSQKSSESFVRQRRGPQRQVPKQKNDIYVNKQSDFKFQLERAQKLLDSGYDEVFIHGLGAAINRAVNLALQLQERGHGLIEISAQTLSTQVVDDFRPLDEEQEGYSETKTKSSVKIKVYKISTEESRLPPKT
jgi:ribonuclease P/MRP protein subunit RPP20